GAEAGFWAAVDRADADALAVTVGADEQARAVLRGAATVLPVLSAWRRRQRERAVLDSWRDQVTWVPVPDPGPVPLTGRWLLVVPAGQAGTGLAADCARVLGGGGAEVLTLEVDPAGLDRQMLAGRLAQTADGQAAEGLEDGDGRPGRVVDGRVA